MAIRKSTDEELVNELAELILAQQHAIWVLGNSRKGNNYANKQIKIWHILRSHGDVGREALTQLFYHPRPIVRVQIASLLLRYKTEQALTILREVIESGDSCGFEAKWIIQDWEKGRWNLDPDDDPIT